MSIQIDQNHSELHIMPDCNGEREKRTAVFLADIFSPGSTAPGDLEPHNWEQVKKDIAGDVSPEVVQRFCAMAGVEVKL